MTTSTNDFWPDGLEDALKDRRTPLDIVQDLVKDIEEGSKGEFGVHYVQRCHKNGSTENDVYLRCTENGNECRIFSLYAEVHKPYPVHIASQISHICNHQAGTPVRLKKVLIDILSIDNMEPVCRNLILAENIKVRKDLNHFCDALARFLTDVCL